MGEGGQGPVIFLRQATALAGRIGELQSKLEVDVLSGVVCFALFCFTLLRLLRSGLHRSGWLSFFLGLGFPAQELLQ